ncbi:MAG: glycosyltransferase family 25 protein [Terricaulis sp.]
MQTFVINLDRDSDRLVHMRAECARAGLSFERFSALRGDALPEALRGYFDAHGSPLSNGEIGCYASHLALHQRVASGEIASPALILEDDVALCENFRGVIAGLIAALPREWDIVRLSNGAKRAYVTRAALPNDHALIRYSVVPTSTGAYLISASGARKFLEQAVRALPVDQDLRRVWRWKLDAYGVTPIPATPDVLQASSIDALGPKGQRKDDARRTRMRRQRAAEGGERHGWNRTQFGFWRWLGSEAVNAALVLVPRKARAGFLARAGKWLGADVPSP